MKILLINVYNWRKGGSEAVFFNTADLLEKAGHEVVRFTLKWDENLPSKFERYFPESKATRRGPLRPLANLVNYFYHFEAARKLEELIDAERPDIADIHLIWGQLTPSILRTLRRRGVPAVLTAHDYRIVCPAYTFRDGQGRVCERCEGHKFYNCLLHKCSKGKLVESAIVTAEQYFRNAFFNPARMASAMVFVSDFSRRKHLEFMPALGKLPLLTLHNMAAAGISRPKTAQEIADAEPYMLYFGRLSAEKGLPTLVEAMKQCRDVKFKVVGSGPLEEQIRRTIAAEGLDNVGMLGYRTGSDLAALVRGARLTLVTSECYENNPMTIVESYAAGVPVIGSAIGGIPEIVDEGSTGFLFAPGNAAELATAIRRGWEMTPAELAAMSEAAADYARNHFDPEAYGESLVSFFQRVIASKSN